MINKPVFWIYILVATVVMLGIGFLLIWRGNDVSSGVDDHSSFVRSQKRKVAEMAGCFGTDGYDLSSRIRDDDSLRVTVENIKWVDELVIDISKVPLGEWISESKIVSLTILNSSSRNDSGKTMEISAEALSYLPLTLEDLTLQKNITVSREGWEQIKRLRKLEKLKMWNCDAAQLFESALAAFPNLVSMKALAPFPPNYSEMFEARPMLFYMGGINDIEWRSVDDFKRRRELSARKRERVLPTAQKGS